MKLIQITGTEEIKSGYKEPRMSYQISLGTTIFPYNSKDGTIGFARDTTIEVEFEENEIMERLNIRDPENDEFTDFIGLSLGTNPSDYDLYLVRKDQIIYKP